MTNDATDSVLHIGFGSLQGSVLTANLLGVQLVLVSCSIGDFYGFDRDSRKKFTFVSPSRTFTS